MDTLSLQLMNTEFYVAIPKGKGIKWKEQAEKWLRYIATEWSRFEKNNELSQVNDLKIGDTLRINAALYECLYRANDY